MQRDAKDVPPFTCGLDATLRVIGGKWKPLILYFLGQGPKRYGELKRCVRGVSDKMLIQQLKELEMDGFVARTDYKEIPPRVDYTVTVFGQGLCEALVPLWLERRELGRDRFGGRQSGSIPGGLALRPRCQPRWPV